MISLSIALMTLLLAPSAGGEGLPVVEFLSEGGLISGTHEVKVSVTGDFAEGEVYYYVDVGPEEMMDDPHDGTYRALIDADELADGPHTIYVWAYNTTGEKAIATQDLVVDNHSPEVHVTSEGGLVSGEILVTGTAEDVYLNESAVYCVVDDDIEAGKSNVMTRVDDHFEFTLNTTKYADGDHHVRVWAYDQWGSNNTSQAIDLEIDNTPPAVELLSDTGKQTGTYMLRVRVVDPHLDGVNASVGGGLPEGMTGPGDEWTLDIDTTALDDGEVEIVVEAVDTLGNPTVYTFSITAANTPDLEIVNVAWDRTEVKLGKTLGVTVTVRNNGSVDVVGFKVAIVEGGEVLEDLNVTTPLAPGGVEDYVVVWKTKGPGKHRLSVQVDPGDEIAESDETDNAWPLESDIAVQEVDENPGPGALLALLGLLGLGLYLGRRRT